MPRTIRISASSDKAEQILNELQNAAGIIGLQHQRGSSIRPPGDIVSAQTTVEGLKSVYRILDRVGLGDGICVTTSEPQSLVSPAHEKAIEDESNEASLEEMASMLRRETNISNNYVLAMGLSGAIAAAGLWTNTLHIVIGAMVIAPGFEPLLRIAFGLIAPGKPRMSRGLAATAVGYGAMAVGALLAGLVLRLIEPNAGTDLARHEWVQFWTSVSPSGVLIALLASAAGMAIIAAQRSVLSAGVMIALALIPAMSIVGMGLAIGNLELAGKGLMRWAVDASCVLAASALVLSVKRSVIHRRVSLD